MGLLLDFFLVILVLMAGWWTIGAKDGCSAAVAFVTYGLVLALIWIRIAAPDVALTEAAIGSGLTGGMLIAASTRLESARRPARPGPATRRLGIVLSALLAAALAWAVLSLPYPPPSLAKAAITALPPTGLGNPITGVLLSFRAVDTLLEKVVLILALLGTWSLAPDRLWGGVPGRKQPRHADSPLTLLAQILPPIGFVIGWHILWVGANEPGGAFQGGTILAAMWMLAVMAGLVDVPATSRLWLRLLVIVGPGLFLIVGFAGFAFAGGFLAYPAGFAKPLILVIEIVLTVSIAAILLLLLAGPPERQPPA